MILFLFKLDRRAYLPVDVPPAEVAGIVAIEQTAAPVECLSS